MKSDNDYERNCFNEIFPILGDNVWAGVSDAILMVIDKRKYIARSSKTTNFIAI